jgi:hypothetical protein
MDDTNVQLHQEAASVAIDEGIDFTITVAHLTWFHRCMHRLFPRWDVFALEREFNIKPAYTGTLLKVSKLLLGMDIPDDPNLKGAAFIEAMMRGVVENRDKMIRILALAIHNRESEPPESLLRFLGDNLTANELMTLVQAAVRQMDITRFFVSTALARNMGVIGPMKNHADTPATSGTASTESSNTTGSDGANVSGGSPIQT